MFVKLINQSACENRRLWLLQRQSPGRLQSVPQLGFGVLSLSCYHTHCASASVALGIVPGHSSPWSRIPVQVIPTAPPGLGGRLLLASVLPPEDAREAPCPLLRGRGRQHAHLIRFSSGACGLPPESSPVTPAPPPPFLYPQPCSRLVYLQLRPEPIGPCSCWWLSALDLGTE